MEQHSVVSHLKNTEITNPEVGIYKHNKKVRKQENTLSTKKAIKKNWKKRKKTRSRLRNKSRKKEKTITVKKKIRKATN